MTDSAKPKVLITHPEVSSEAIEILRQKCKVIILPSLKTQKEEIISKIPGVDAILWANHEPLTEEILAFAGPQLKVISLMSGDTDNVEMEAIRNREILLGYTPGIMETSVAELAIGLMLAACRRFYEGRLKIETFSWDQHHLNWMLGQDISQSTVGFFGFGRIGQAIARRLLAFDINEILYKTRNRLEDFLEKNLRARKVSFPYLLEKSDIIFIAAPLTDETRNTFNYEAFTKMKKTAVLVNVARGDIVNQSDLVAALKHHQIFAAGIDRMVPEPLSGTDPLMALKNLIITPHLGLASYKTRIQMSVLAAQNILKGLNDEPLIAPVV